MAKRIFAWAMLAGFVILMLNLIIFRYYWQLSMFIYLIIFFAFIFTNGKLSPDETSKKPDDDNRGAFNR